MVSTEATPTTAPATQTRHKGIEWALHATPAAEVFTPEDLSDVQRSVAQTIREFIRGAVAPVAAAMENQDFGHHRRLLREAADLGLTGILIPERYGGLGLDEVTQAVVTESF